MHAGRHRNDRVPGEVGRRHRRLRDDVAAERDQLHQRRAFTVGIEAGDLKRDRAGVGNLAAQPRAIALETISFGRDRKSFSTDGWNRISKLSILLQPPHHVIIADGFLIPALGDHNEVVKVLHQLLVFIYGQYHGRLFALGVHEIELPLPGGRGELKAGGLFEQVGHDLANQRIGVAAPRAGSMRRGHLAATVRLGHAERPHSRIILITLFDDPAGRFQEGERTVPGYVVFPVNFWRIGRGIRRGQHHQGKRDNGHES